MRTCPSCGQANPEGARFCNACGAPLEAAPEAREQRKTVTVLFCDITGSTALGESTDPEALRAVLARYFERMKGILESHGGSVEKFIGDAVMAVFGVPQVHEDDALRACRAAVEMREALPELGVQARIGVNTGEVVTGTEERLATGDAVNVAARLEQAAQPGEILIGEETLELVRDAVANEPVERLQLKGKAEAVAAYRLLAVLEELERAHVARFVGRRTETELIQAAWRRASEERACQLITIVGEAGVGKSRLVAEALATIPARVIRGRCLSYGDGITYWPVVEVLKQLEALPSDETAASALQSLLGENERATSAEEIAWAFRRLLEEQAPLMCVFDDLQWAEDKLFDLVEHIALFSGGSPLLLVCIARPELSERRAEWEISVRLEPLPREAVDELIPDTIEDELRERVKRAAGGNPLFVQEMVAMVSETEGDVAVPRNLQALLAARLDQLDTAERAVLERGAIEGEVFHRGSVQALSGNGQVTPRLAALVRKALVRPDRSQLRGDDAFRFRHLLIRDAAYDALPKAARAELHERFAQWLEEHGSDLVELDEILGYHLEQAVRYRGELGLPQDDGLRDAAQFRLALAGSRAFRRSDFGAAVNLYERAVALLAEGEISLHLEFDLQDALFRSGRIREAISRAESLAERGCATGDRVVELSGLLWQAVVRLYVEPDQAAQSLRVLIPQATREFDEAQSDPGRYLVHFARGTLGHVEAHFEDEVEAVDLAMDYARRTGREQWARELLPSAAAARTYGPTPVPEVLAWIDAQEAMGLHHPALAINRAAALTMLGQFDQARQLNEALIASSRERGAVIPLALSLTHGLPGVEMSAGNPAAAVAAGEEGCMLLEEIGEKSWLSTGLAKLGRAHLALGHLDVADELAGRAAELGGRDDAVTQTLWRQVRAGVLAARGQHDEAERLGREALAITEQTDMLDSIGDAHARLGDVLAAAADRAGAEASYRAALTSFEQKGNLVGAGRVRGQLASLLELEQ